MSFIIFPLQSEKKRSKKSVTRYGVLTKELYNVKTKKPQLQFLQFLGDKRGIYNLALIFPSILIYIYHLCSSSIIIIIIFNQSLKNEFEKSASVRLESSCRAFFSLVMSPLFDFCFSFDLKIISLHLSILNFFK